MQAQYTNELSLFFIMSYKELQPTFQQKIKYNIKFNYTLQLLEAGNVMKCNWKAVPANSERNDKKVDDWLKQIGLLI